MLGLGGLKMLKRLRVTLPDECEVSMISYGLPDSYEAIGALRHGGVDFLTKPVSL